MKDSGVYLYTHWGAGTLEHSVRLALSKRWRWDDEEYLTRIIFDTMSAGEQGVETGFGISTSEHGDNEILIIVDCESKEVVVLDVCCGKERRGSFDEFVAGLTI